MGRLFFLYDTFRKGATVVGVAFYLWLVSCPVTGQVNPPLKQLTEADYGLWGSLRLMEMDRHGKWVSYLTSYRAGDSLHVKDVTGEKTYHFPGGQYGNFGDGAYVSYNNGILDLLDLATGKVTIHENVAYFDFSGDGKLLILATGETDGSKALKIMSIDGKILRSYLGMNGYTFDKAKNQVAAYTHGNLLIVSLDGKFTQTTVYDDPGRTVANFVFSPKGDALAYHVLREGKPQSICLYEKTSRKTRTFTSPPGFLDQDQQLSSAVYPFRISDDLKKVFFGYAKTAEPKPAEELQIWNAADKVLYPKRLKTQGWYDTRLGLWSPVDGTHAKLNGADRPLVFTTADSRFAITYDPLVNEPQYTEFSTTDYYIQEVGKGKPELVVTDVTVSTFDFFAVPSGNRVCYFKGGHYYVYDPVAKKHRNLTEGLPFPVYNEQNDMPHNPDQYGLAGFSVGGKEALLYDRYDIWKINLDNGMATRLTQGRETAISFRFNQRVLAVDMEYFYNGGIAETIDLSRDMILQATGDDGTSGFYWRSKNGEITKLAHRENMIDDGKLANGTVVYMEQAADVSPRIRVVHNGKDIVLAENNKQQKNYEWTRTERISYTVRNGGKLSGTLYYPAGYIAGKKYPMLVHVYSRQSDVLHKYVWPGLYADDGYNQGTYVHNGYFVLHPDITYEIGKTGQSAVECTVAATQAVIATGMVDPKRIGLTGHSFGGYETYFIIGQTDIFAAAMAGCGATDLRSFYLNMNWQTHKPDLWRMEA
ncbi:MAG: hypothetical protein EOP49_10350, partial [Sphingobacteriales bacterium]